MKKVKNYVMAGGGWRTPETKMTPGIFLFRILLF
nr:MAG TPA: hypothetical protein [Caudoviricetes sp.]